MIFALAVLSDFLATLAFEVNGGGIEKDQVDRAEQIPALIEQFLFDLIFGASRCLQNSNSGIVVQRFAQKGHGAIEMV